MLFDTRGIVLNQTKLNDTRLIVNIYTEKFGRMTYVVSISKKKKSIRNMLRPFYIVEMEAFHKSNKGVQNILDMQLSDPLVSIPFNVYKSTQALFLSEILSKVLIEEEKNEALFDFLVNNVKLLDLMDDNITAFHLFFMSRLTKYLGFYPILNYDSKCSFFNIEKGEFVSSNNGSNRCLSRYLSEKLFDIFTSSAENFISIKIDDDTRILLTSAILNYYSFHVSGFKSLKSLKVLNELFD